MDWISGLLGVIIGGLITYVIQKRDEYIHDRREALALVLDWLDPIDLAVSHAVALFTFYR